MADGKSEESGSKSSSGGMIVGVLLASIIAAGGGVFLGYSQFGKSAQEKTVKKQDHGAPAAAHGEDGKGKPDVKYVEGSRIRDLAPITTNLAGQPPAWIRLEASVLLSPEAAENPEPAEEEVLLRAINEDVVAYLRTVQLVSLQGPSGFQSLREDLDERVRLRSEGKAQELMIQAMILE